MLSSLSLTKEARQGETRTELALPSPVLLLRAQQERSFINENKRLCSVQELTVASKAEDGGALKG